MATSFYPGPKNHLFTRHRTKESTSSLVIGLTQAPLCCTVKAPQVAANINAFLKITSSIGELKNTEDIKEIYLDITIYIYL